MMPETLFFESQAASRQLVRARVVEVDAAGVVHCLPDEGDEATPIACDLIQMVEGPPLQLTEGDAVLVAVMHPEDTRGVVLGRIGPRRIAISKAEIPDEIVIEAKNGLTLKCGEGSITMRGDGKVLIKGKDLVSHAKRMNRIKGGGVAIN